MKKVLLVVLMSLIVVGNSWAQIDSVGSLKQSTVDALVDLGIQLYERNDYAQATVVFNRALSYDATQAQALKYLGRMNVKPARPALKPVIIAVPVIKPVAARKPVPVTDLTIEELRERISQKNQEINQLKAELTPTK